MSEQTSTHTAAPRHSADAETLYGRFDAWRDRHRDLALSVILAMQVLIMFVVAPLSSAKLLGTEYIDGLRIAMAAIAVLIVNRNRALGIVVAIVFAVSLFETAYVRTGTASQEVALVNAGVVTVFDIAVAAIVGQAAFGSGRITIHRIMGAVILYLYIGLIFAGFYRLVDGFDAGSFAGGAAQGATTRGESLYFSMGALTSAGGARNLVPVHAMARSLAVLESVIGQLYPAIFIGRLVTLHGTIVEHRSRKQRE